MVAAPDALVPPLMPGDAEPLPVALPVVLPEVLGLLEDPPEAAVLSFTLPSASLQCVAAEMLPLAPALGVVDVWAEAASTPPARKADANSTDLIGFIVPSPWVFPPWALNARRWTSFLAT